jgi:hypothetical protein
MRVLVYTHDLPALASINLLFANLIVKKSHCIVLTCISLISEIKPIFTYVVDILFYVFTFAYFAIMKALCMLSALYGL